MVGKRFVWILLFGITLLVLMLAGAGDEIQGIKKGVLELADALAINKADGDNIEKANKAKGDYEAALDLFCDTSSVWNPQVLTCSALEMTGIDKIWETILEHREQLISSGELERKRKRQALDWMWSLVQEGLKDRFYHNMEVEKRLMTITREVERGTLGPTLAANQLLSFVDIHYGECPK